MRTKITLSIFSFIVVQNIFAQNWTAQTSNTTRRLYDACFINSNIGFVCGDTGTVLKTTDGGANWNMVATGTTNMFGVIKFPDNNTGYIGGFTEAGYLKTTDGGNTWNYTNLNLTGYNGGGMWFTSADTGFYSVGNFMLDTCKILKTVDGGLTWSTVYADTGWISYFFFPDKLNGYVTVSDSRIFKTSDGGNSWSVQSLTNNWWMSGIFFFDKDNGFAGGGKPDGSGQLFKTTNGGTNWNPIGEDSSIAKVFFTDNNNGYYLKPVDIYTGEGDLKKTTDGGNTWAKVNTPGDSIGGFYFLNNNLGWAVGERGMILKYTGGTGINENGMNSSQFGEIIYPNPFADKTRITFNLSKKEEVKVVIYDMMGKEVLLLVNNNLPAGKHSVEWEGGKFISGIYFYKIIGNEIVTTGKIVMIK